MDPLRFATLRPPAKAMDADDKPHVEHIEFADARRPPPRRPPPPPLLQDAANTQTRKKKKPQPRPRSRTWSVWLCLPIGSRRDSDSDSDTLVVEGDQDATPKKDETGFWQRPKMKKFGFGKKSSDGDDDSIRSGMFGRKKESSKSDNPYAQSQVAEDPYARMTPYQKAKAGLSNGPRPGGVGLPGGPAPGNAPGGPPPPYSSQSGPNGGYGADRYGSQNGYGSNRYDTNADAYAANSRYTVPISRPGGYGGLSDDNDPNREALLGDAKTRYVPEKNDGAASSSYGRAQAPASYSGAPDYGNKDALFGAAKDRYASRQADGYGQSGGSGAGDSSGGYGEPRELTAEEQEQLEVQQIKRQIDETRDESLSSIQRSVQVARRAEETMYSTLARLGAQGERLHNTEKNLDLAANHNRVAEDRTKELKHLNRSMFAVRVSNPFTAKDRAAQREAEILATHRMEREQREATRRDGYQSVQQLEGDFKALDPNRPLGLSKVAVDSKFVLEDDDDDTPEIIEERKKKELGIAAGEEELDALAKSLNRGARAMGRITDEQNQRIDRIGAKSDKVDDQVRLNRAKLSRIK